MRTAILLIVAVAFAGGCSSSAARPAAPGATAAPLYEGIMYKCATVQVGFSNGLPDGTWDIAPSSGGEHIADPVLRGAGSSLPSSVWLKRLHLPRALRDRGRTTRSFPPPRRAEPQTMAPALCRPRAREQPRLVGAPSCPGLYNWVQLGIGWAMGGRTHARLLGRRAPAKVVETLEPDACLELSVLFEVDLLARPAEGHESRLRPRSSKLT